jgi:hypothetical protein
VHVKNRSLLVLALGASFAAGAIGCAARVYAEPPVYYGEYDTYYASTVPPNITAYPRVYYEGSYAYYVGGNWYYPYGDRWVVFRHAPPILERQRPYVQQAPPAYRNYAPAYPRSQPAYPPPATRIR